MTNPEHGFAIVFAKFWRLSSAEKPYPEMAFQLISDTFVPNELMRRCLVRRQSESLTAEVYALPAPVVMCRIKRGFPRHLPNSFWQKV